METLELKDTVTEINLLYGLTRRVGITGKRSFEDRATEIT